MNAVGTCKLAHVHRVWGAAAPETPRVGLGGSRPPGRPRLVGCRPPDPEHTLISRLELQASNLVIWEINYPPGPGNRRFWVSKRSLSARSPPEKVGGEAPHLF